MIEPLYRDQNFAALIQIAAEATGCPPELVEKDHWITLVLRSLALSAHTNDIVFKGGTSLSKAWQLTDRFSEDIDILIDIARYDSRGSKRKKISQIRKVVETIPGLVYSAEDSFQGELNADYVFTYPNQIGNTEIFSGNRLKLEIGFRGGANPSSIFTLNSIMGTLAQERKIVAPDFQPFEMRVLDIRRTFVEKLFAIYSAYDHASIRTKTRHYFDVQKLYETEHVQSFLKTSEFLQLCEDVRINTLHFFQGQSVPSIKQILASPAFTLTEKVRDDLVAGLRDDRLLYYKQAPNIKAIEAVCAKLTKVMD